MQVHKVGIVTGLSSGRSQRQAVSRKSAAAKVIPEEDELKASRAASVLSGVRNESGVFPCFMSTEHRHCSRGDNSQVYAVFLLQG